MKSKRLIYRQVSFTLITAMLICFAAGCNNDVAPTMTPDIQPTSVVTDKPEHTLAPTSAPTSKPTPSLTPEPTEAVVAARALSTGFAPQFDKAGFPYVPVEVTPRVADYSINPDLSNVVNLDQFPNLTEAQRDKIASNGFVAAYGEEEQLFYIYEKNSYKYIPNFITTDSVLQVYHVFYDYALRSAEGLTLLPNALALNKNMLRQLMIEYDKISEPDVKLQAQKALGYFGVAELAFGGELPADFPEEVKKLVESEMELFNAAVERCPSPLFEYEIDYSLFTPRGHYTRSEELKKYFKGMSWYGTVPFPMYKNYGEERDPESAMCSIIITTALCRLPESDGGALWENIYSPTQFFVGAADDYTPFQFAQIIADIYGDYPDLNELSDETKLDLFFQEVEKLPKPQINAKLDLAKALGLNVPSGPQFRFMGQRYIPDSEILQELSESVWRAFPTGLDVFATLGSQRAADIIAEVYDPTLLWPEYTENFERMKEKFINLPDSTWRSNMYYAWLWTQNSLTGEYGEGYPMFMRNIAWQDKSLTTALGSWAEMRHDTVLYAKGAAAERGGGPDPLVYSYVEPNAELYNRLLWLTAYSRENLSARGIMPENIKYNFESFESMLTLLRDCAIKELSGEDLTEIEHRWLFSYGGLLESLTSKCTENGYKWHQIESATDRNMAVIADVHTAIPGGYLEEAVGTAAEIYVVVPINGELYLTRGAMFDYYEFISVEERLTDEKWQAMLKDGEAPERPPLSWSFMEGEAMEVPAPQVQYQAG